MKYILLLLFISIRCWAEVPEQLIHDNTQYVDDYAGGFTSEQKQQLNTRIHTFFDTVQISIVSVKTLGGLEPYEFATRLGNKWGIGSKSSNGLLMLICAPEHKIFLATGRGIQGDMPDIVTGRLIRERALPLFKQGKIFEGVSNLLDGCIATLSPSAKALHDAQRFEEPAEVPWWLWGPLGGLVMAIGGYRLRRKIQEIEAQRLRRKEAETLPMPVINHSVYPDELHHAATRRAQQAMDDIYTQASIPVGSILLDPNRFDTTSSKSDDDDDDSSSYSTGSSYSSSSDYGSSSSSSDSGSSSSSDFGSTDFGGGSFDGGGSGDSW